MINKPGTLLIVRKRMKTASKSRRRMYPPQDGIWGLFEKDNAAYDKRLADRSYQTVDLPYGAPVLLREIEPAPDSRSKNRVGVHILYLEQYLVGYMSHSQLDKWFCYADVWQKFYAAKHKAAQKAAEKAAKTDT